MLILFEKYSQTRCVFQRISVPETAGDAYEVPGKPKAELLQGRRYAMHADMEVNYAGYKEI